MPFTVRANMAAGDIYTAADQNASKGNDDFLWAAVYGPQPPAAATGGTVKQWVKLTGIADAVATEFCTITTTNEAGNTDSGTYHAVFEGLVCHGIDPSLDVATMGVRFHFARATGPTGGVGGNSAVITDITAVATSTVATKSITSTAITVVETSEYIQSVRVNIDLAGATVTTGAIFGLMTVYYAGFSTAPVIASIG